jgi:TPR repeat protein
MRDRYASLAFSAVAAVMAAGLWTQGAAAQLAPIGGPPTTRPSFTPPQPMVQPYRPGVNPPQYPSIRPRDSGPSIFRSDAFKGLYYVDKDVKAAMDKKDYAFLLSYYGKKCQPKDNDGFKATEDFASGGRGVGNCYFLGELYLKGQGVDKDVGKAIGYYETAANGGFWPAVADLADLYLKGKDVPRDDAKGTGYLSAYITNPKNSKVGTCFGASLLGEVYVKGKLVPKNGSEAEKWYQYCLDKADHPNDPTPEDFIVHDLLLLADLYADEGLMPGKLDAAVKLYSRIVKVAGDSHYREDAQPAQRALGQMYIAGRGVPKDAAKGIDLLKTAVNHTVTDPKSAVILYNLYTAGEVVPADPAQAATYLDIAVKAKWPEAETIAARNALRADPPQPDKAKALLLAAVVTGYAPAQYELGNYFVKFGAPGSGPLTAYLWFDLAAQNGNADAAKSRDELATKLSPDDVQKAKTAEGQLKAKYPDIVAN